MHECRSLPAFYDWISPPLEPQRKQKGRRVSSGLSDTLYKENLNSFQQPRQGPPSTHPYFSHLSVSRQSPVLVTAGSGVLPGYADKRELNRWITLCVHLLKSLAFALELKYAVVINHCPAGGVFFG